ncbi:T9SS type B sorting domain-containing protein [Gillisia sp. JM1]|uniref:T9SS type B sorting domain-containing protein n=1 Tax=Gillisia sp. JM1 TaxID=1283286 RepID=UPI00040483B3|nr:T9SS type B sorting domain-containing protein [Gillisia sp. JM1]
MRHPFALVTFFLTLLCQQVVAQKEAANWYFGDHAGLTFNTGLPVALQDGNLQTSEGSATISDRNGNLLFYTDGSNVYNRQHSIMPNGMGLMGNVSSSQSAIIVPKPLHPGIYYIFTVDKPDYSFKDDDPIEGVNYTEVDMSLNFGLGDVTPNQKNLHLITYNSNNSLENEYKSSEKISAVVHNDGISYWVVTQLTNKFYSFKVTQNGVETTPVISITPNSVPPLINNYKVNVTAIGYLKISPNGKKLAVAYSSTNLGDPVTGTKKSGKVFLYDFDDLTGKIDDEKLLLSGSYPYGLEFSPKSTKLYVTANFNNERNVVLNSFLYQYDLESSDINYSQTIINSSSNVAGALQLAIDGRIYRAGYPLFVSNHSLLSVIKNPEAKGNASNYEHNVIDISPKFVKLGLPPFIQSLFLENFDFKFLCQGDETHFFISTDVPYDSVKWDFGDGSFSTDVEPFHTYAQPGTYTVSLTRIINGEVFNPWRKEITIIEIPEILPEYELIQCDLDNDPTDGITEFNLQLAKDPITLGNRNTEIYFYETPAAAVVDSLYQNAISEIYLNQAPGQLIYAKVSHYGSECFDIAEVTLITRKGVKLNPSPAKACDLGNGEAEFNFKTLENSINSELNLPANTSLTFHETENDMASGLNPFPEAYMSKSKTVFILAKRDGICYGTGKLDLKVSPFPNFLASNEFNLCASEFPLNLGSEISINDMRKFSFEWSTGETSPGIIVSEEGTYSLRIVNQEFGCDRTVQFLVNELLTPEIIDIEIESSTESSELTVFTSNDEGNLYSLDDINGNYQTSSVFTNVPGGSHTMYVKNQNNCEIKQQEIVIFGFPQFFTPNDDGYHDSWKPYKITDPEYQIKSLYIFDRYGKLLKQLDPDGKGWDGTLNNRNMPGDDYWFNVILENGREFKGHFSLKR